MDKEAVKKILRRPDETADLVPLYRCLPVGSEEWIEQKAKQVCQLFEPKPSESRLLTDEQFHKLKEDFFGEGSCDCSEIDDTDLCLKIAKAQRDLTASTVRQECQVNLKRIKEGIERIARRCPKEPIGKLANSLVWQEFWKGEGI